MTIEKGQNYVTKDTQIILRAVIFKRDLVLKDIRASYAWNIMTPKGERYNGEYFEGYKVTAGKLLEPIQSYVGNGRSKKCTEHRLPIETGMLQRCEVETVTVDLNE